MMTSSSRNSAGNILRSAVSSGSKDTFEAVLAFLEVELPPDKVRSGTLHIIYSSRYDVQFVFLNLPLISSVFSLISVVPYLQCLLHERVARVLVEGYKAQH